MTEPPVGWAARYHDGRMAATQSVVVALGDDALLIRDPAGGVVTTWPADEVRLIDGGDGQPIRLARAFQPERLSIGDQGALASIKTFCPHLGRNPYQKGGDRKLILWAVAGLGGFLALLFLIVPMIARIVSEHMSPTLEAHLGQLSAEALTRALTKDNKGCGDQRGLDALDRLIAPLTAQMTVKPHVTVIATPVVNAVALPGGQVLLFDGLIKFAKGPNEVAGVLAHEFGHVELHHPTRLTVEHGARSFLVGLFFGDILGGSALASIGLAAVNARFTREMEHEADLRAIALLEGAHLDPGPFGEFFARLAMKEHQADGALLFASHPPSEERARLIKNAAPGGGQALTADDWAALSQMCASAAPPKS